MIAQLVLNGLVTGAIVALPAIALTLTFGILKFPNFAIGAMLTMGAYGGWTLNALFGMSLLAATVLSATAMAVIAMAIDRLVFVHLREREGLTLLVASMGVAFVLENICRFAFGNDARNLDIAVARPVRWNGLRVNHEQIITGGSVLACLVVLFLVVRFTPLGRAMRAVADNPSLAAARGIERDSIIAVTWAIVGGLCALAGTLIALDRAIDPLMGWNYQINVFAAAILGGLGSLFGAVVGALVIGVVEELSALVIPTNYRQAIGFAMIVLLLLLRPQGLFGTVAIRK
ncbi:MAG: branched-chain amino acid ABC transporter permease [Hyphomicrobiaceae bacterium]|nr:branched-chain amino acid ABC transporter permease [Hyphomicrobiaceae bacterium]